LRSRLCPSSFFWNGLWQFCKSVCAVDVYMMVCAISSFSLNMMRCSVVVGAPNFLFPYWLQCALQLYNRLTKNKAKNLEQIFIVGFTARQAGKVGESRPQTCTWGALCGRVYQTHQELSSHERGIEF
jgi:hypothetical protein